jgi:hypothetical protein
MIQRVGGATQTALLFRNKIASGRCFNEIVVSCHEVSRAACAAVHISNAAYVPLSPVYSTARVHMAFAEHGCVTVSPPAPYSRAAVCEFLVVFLSPSKHNLICCNKICHSRCVT